MTPYLFQQKAIGELVAQFKRLWHSGGDCTELTFKSPTGSGKTFMTESFIRELANQPDWDYDVAFVWVTFSDDLAMQSRDKFMDYFFPNIGRRLLTVDDFDKGKLEQNDILFMNWQKLVSRKASDRVLRRPDDERMAKEQGYYFEDVAENTIADCRHIVMIIDESHKNVTESAWRDVILPLHPKIIVKVSATPEHEPNYSDVKNGKAGFVEVEREDVVAENLIKEQIVCQTEEDLKARQGEDQDALLLHLAMDRRRNLVDVISEKGIAVNPLVLIQLPNDDKVLKDSGVKTKEQIVTEYLHSHGVTDDKIAYWFDNRKENMDGIENNDNKVEYLLFKQAAGTGWDCPRAQILVMFRDIKSPTFYTQTLGRILRMPIHNAASEQYQVFRTGYLYTNYNRSDVHVPEETNKNKAKLYTAYNRKGETVELDENLRTDFIPRADYGDLGEAMAFQQCLVGSFDKSFGIGSDDFTIGQKRIAIERKGLTLNRRLTNKLIVNATFRSFDDLGTEIRCNGSDEEYEVSRNDVEKLFTALCSQLLSEQTEDDAKIGNIARSWSPLKSALREWMLHSIDVDADTCYRIFIKDVNRGSASVFRQCVTRALKDYRPQLNAQIEKRQVEARKREAEVFKILSSYSYTEDYEALDVSRCILDKQYLPKDYDGKKNETDFIKHIDRMESVDWWFKNGDYGKDYLAFTYHNSVENKDALFYPDWIIRYKDGRIGLYDTKGGQTATSQETADKAAELQRRIDRLNGQGHIRYEGGIIILANGVWRCNSSQHYACNPSQLSEDWKVF